MPNHDVITLPRPTLHWPIEVEEQKDRLSEIISHIEGLETQYRNLQIALGIGEPSMPPDPGLPEFVELHRWSNFSAELFDAYRTGAKSRELEEAQMYSKSVRVREHVADLVELVPRLRGKLKAAAARVSAHINRLAFPETVEYPKLTDLLLKYLKRHIDDAHKMLTTLVDQVREAAEAIDWVEIVSENADPVTMERAYSEHEENLRAIRHLGTDVSSSREQVPAGAFRVAEQTLAGGQSVVFGRSDREARVLRESLADNIKELADSGAKFLQLDLPKANQQALKDFLASEGSVADQDALFDQLQRNGTPSFGVEADGALIELIQAAHTAELDVVAGGPMITAEHPLDRRATTVPYLAGMHNSLVETHGGPGIIVTNRYYTNYIDGLARHIPGLVSIDQATDIPPGETLLTPWSVRYTEYSADDPDLRSNHARYFEIREYNENSTLVFNPQPR